jgi:Tol biopolymer transport system component
MNEHTSFQDPSTGTVVHQVTNAPSISHPTYFLQNSFSHSEEKLFFTSYRSGSAQLHVLQYPDGDILQLTHSPRHPPHPVFGCGCGCWPSLAGCG